MFCAPDVTSPHMATHAHTHTHARAHTCTHTRRGPFTYEALPPADISFVPLKQSRAFRADELMEVR
jgi:hypothetical protein